jgi:hypothetical protein
MKSACEKGMWVKLALIVSNFGFRMSCEVCFSSGSVAQYLLALDFLALNFAAAQ